ncbi:hypothetical protein FO519_008137 [Halicephalobus sp. NKZ332]|nr:hypothetical protein FO519_008137 [Halicephalobus sp. NKZ332]
MWISNTATAAMMLPIVISVICELDYCRRRQENPTELIIKKSITDIDFESIPKGDTDIYKALLLSIAFSASIGGTGTIIGVQDSGLSVIIGEYLSSFSGMPEWAFGLIACFLVTMLTEFSSNVATASIFIPLVASIAKAHGTNPLLYILPTTLSCSYAFMFPAGTPPNAIVFSAGLLKITELVRAGFFLNIFGYVMVFTITHSYAPLIFNFESPGFGDGFFEQNTTITS